MDKVTAARKFLKREQWIKLIRECQLGGMSVVSWCKENGIVEQTYYKNLKKLREELVDNLPIPAKPERQVPTVFKKLEVQAPLPNTQAAIIIRLPHATLEIAVGTSQSTIPYLSKYLGHSSVEDTFYYYHQIDAAFKLVRSKDNKSKMIIPEVTDYEYDTFE